MRTEQAGCVRASRLLPTLLLALTTQPVWALSGNAQISLVGQGRFEALVAGLEQADAGKPLKTPDLHALCYGYGKLKRYDAVLPCLDRLDRQITTGDSETRLFGLDDATPSSALIRADVLIDLGQYDAAAAQAQRALDWFAREHSSDLDIRFEALADQVIAYRLGGRRAQAEAAMKALEATGLGLTGGSYRGARAIALARANMALGRYQAVLDALASDFTLGLRRFLDNLNTGAVFTGSNNWLWLELPRAFMAAKAHQELGQLDEARRGLDAILAIPQVVHNGEIHWMSLYARGQIAVRDGDTAKAADCWRQALDVLDRQRSRIASETNKIGFVADKMRVYDDLIDLQVQRGDAAGALLTAERAKSRALVDLLAERQHFAVGEDREAQRASDAFRTLQQAEVRSRWQGETRTGDLRTAADARAALQAGAPALAALVTVRTPGLAEIRQHLAPGETLLLYHLGREQLHTFTLTADSVNVRSGPTAGLSDDIARLRQDLAEQAPGTDALLRRLHQRLIPATLDGHAPTTTREQPGRLLIVPHKGLHYVPFAALRGERGYLLEHWSVRVLPSADLLSLLPAPQPGYGDTLLILGNPDLGDSSQDLPAAEQEARAIAERTGSPRLRLRQAASESAFRAEAPTVSALHIASHGEFRGDRPLESALLLAPDAHSDGRLSVAELYELRLGNRLVVLSACETGVGAIASGDDIVGLVRGFLYAGTGAVLSSLWQVDDSATASLMTSFYAGLDGQGSRDALRQAQLQTLRTHPHPFFWAAFFITGATP